MLERVAQGQTRFNTTGLVVDNRGIALGRYGVLVFPALDGVVGWLRLYSDEAGLEDLLAELAIYSVRTQLRARAFILVLPAASSYVLDRAARCARLSGGTSFTGTAKHFVAFRDERSPYGYDVVGTVAGDGDFVLHGHAGSMAYSRDGQLDVGKLIFRLSLTRVPGGERLDDEARRVLVLTVPPGLSAGVIRYLWRNRVQARVAQVHLAERSEFTARGSPDGYMLIQVDDLPARLLAGFRGTPGLTIYRPIGERVAVEVGWRHPVELSSAGGLFAADKLYLFSGARDTIDVIAGPLELADARHLAPVSLEQAPTVREGKAAPAEAVGIKLRLAPSLLPPRRVIGTLIDGADAARLKRLIYFLPPVLLRGHRMAITERGILLVATANVDLVPLGTLLAELTPGLLLPLGMDLVPRVAPDVLATALGHVPGKMTVFPHEGGPFQVADAQLAPLERRALAALDVPTVAPIDLSVAPPAGQPRVVNDAVGAFALWGFPAPQPGE
jgi:hypothetical protein